jgi:hypothetical protein
VTGPEHYRAAEQDLAAMDGKSIAGVSALITRAQVHATLALAAATALNTDTDGGLPASDYDAWVQAASEYSRGEQP